MRAWAEERQPDFTEDVFDVAVTWVRQSSLFEVADEAERRALNEALYVEDPADFHQLEEATTARWLDMLCSKYGGEQSPIKFELAVYEHADAACEVIARVLECSSLCSSHVHDALLQAWRNVFFRAERKVNLNVSGETPRELVFYISGWLIKWAISRVSRRSVRVRASVEAALGCRADGEDDDLPDGLLLAREKHADHLKYPCAEFFNMVERFEEVFQGNMSLDMLARHGDGLINRICAALVRDKETKRLYALVPGSENSLPLSEFVHGYARMRGRDFACQVRAKGKDVGDACSTRQRLSVIVSGVAARASAMVQENGQNDDEVDGSDEVDEAGDNESGEDDDDDDDDDDLDDIDLNELLNFE